MYSYCAISQNIYQKMRIELEYRYWNHEPNKNIHILEHNRRGITDAILAMQIVKRRLTCVSDIGFLL